ncbi:MAG: hypothetical protein ACI4MI_03190 [Christensenellales bacterium]
MKKSIVFAVIIVLAVCLIAFSGCSGSSPYQKKLGNSAPWISMRDKTETSVYSVQYTTDDGVENGVYTVTVNRLDNGSVTVNDKSYSNFTGYVASATLAMDNGDSIETKVVAYTTMQVKASYSKSVIDGETVEVSAEYSNKDKVYYTRTVNSESVEDSIKIKDFFSSPYTDNAMLYLLARSFPSDVSSFSISMPDFTSNQLNSVLLNKISSSSELSIEETSYTVSIIELSINRSFPGKGTPLKCYVSNDVIGESTNAIVKIEEGNAIYTLVSVTVE